MAELVICLLGWWFLSLLGLAGFLGHTVSGWFLWPHPLALRGNNSSGLGGQGAVMLRCHHIFCTCECPVHSRQNTAWCPMTLTLKHVQGSWPSSARGWAAFSWAYFS